jgi:hypothetical protein
LRRTNLKCTRVRLLLLKASAFSLSRIKLILSAKVLHGAGQLSGNVGIASLRLYSPCTDETAIVAGLVLLLMLLPGWPRTHHCNHNTQSLS